MRSAQRVLIPALGIAVFFWTGVSLAQTHDHGGHMAEPSPRAEGETHSHERCELHGGNVFMTPTHPFETVFAPDGIRVYMYASDENPVSMDKISGTVRITTKHGGSRELKLVPNVVKKGESAVYFCPMYDSPPQMAPGRCPGCGMNLILQGGLFAAVDLSKVEPGTVKAVVHLTGLDGKEKEATFTVTNVTEQHNPETSAPPTGQHTHAH